MSKTISIHSFRGGTGKSNTTANLSVMLARKGFRVAIVDTDIQSPGVHVLFGFDEEQITHSLNDYLWGKSEIDKAAYDVTDRILGENAEGTGRLFLVPASIKSGEIGRVLKDGYDVGLLNDGFRTLIQKLDLDYLMIDTHPGVNEETLLSIIISDMLILVLRPDSQDFQGTSVTLELARRLEVEKIGLIVNKIPPGMDRVRLKQKVEASYDAKVVAMLPLNNEIVHLASSAIFVDRFPEHPFTQELEFALLAVME
ncbi:MinD/ParA family protein [bacterium]|nr:MinD/ParA family protein [bacterium]